MLCVSKSYKNINRKKNIDRTAAWLQTVAIWEENLKKWKKISHHELQWTTVSGSCQITYNISQLLGPRPRILEEMDKRKIWRITCTILSRSLASSLGLTYIRCRIIYLVLSVLPAPDSPDTRMTWFFPVACSSRNAWSATQNKCGAREARTRNSLYSSWC